MLKLIHNLLVRQIVKKMTGSAFPWLLIQTSILSPAEATVLVHILLEVHTPVCIFINHYTLFLCSVARCFGSQSEGLDWSDWTLLLAAVFLQ
jgi:hypothetical protein